MRSVQQAVLLGFAVLLLGGWAFPRPPEVRLPRFHAPGPVDVPILEYHRVSTIVAGLPGLTMQPGAFAAEREWLHGAGYHAITQAQLYDALRYGAPLPRRPVLITFDDGYRDVLWDAAPLLHRLHMHATEYVITSRVDAGDPSFLSWPELRRLEGLGFDIGSHTVHHVPLTLVPRERAYAELYGSRRALEEHLRRPVRWLSYPMGDTSPEVAALAQLAGYRLAVTERPGTVQTYRDRLFLRRYEILPTTGVGGVAALVESAQK